LNLLLGIDVGTTSCKAVAYNEAGTAVAQGKAATVTHYEPSGGSYYQPDEIWQAVIRVVRQVLAELPDSATITGLSITSMGEAGVPIDAHGEPTYPVITWFDPRSLPQAEQIRQLLGAERIFKITGLDLNPIFSVPKLMWLRDNEPEIFSRTVKWLNIPDFIYFKMTGAMATDYSIASRTMALDINTKSWSGEILNRVGLDPALFPQLVPSGTVVGTMTGEAAALTGLPAGLPVVAGGHDHYCGSMASGILLGNRVLDSSGTAESIHGLIAGDETFEERFCGFRVGRYIDPEKLYMVGGLVSSGITVDWAMERVASGDRDYATVMNAAAATPPGAQGLLFLPHLRGSGAPAWDPRSRGTFVGLQATHNSPEMLRSVIEGLCFEVRNIVQSLQQKLGYPVELLTVIGGGSKNGFWQQTKADITGIPVEVPDLEEATALGAALLAGVGTGVYRDLKDASSRTYRTKVRYQPHPELRETYDRLFGIYRQVYPAVAGINSELDSFVKWAKAE
jgi:xylulokinase